MTTNRAFCVNSIHNQLVDLKLMKIKYPEKLGTLHAHLLQEFTTADIFLKKLTKINFQVKCISIIYGKLIWKTKQIPILINVWGVIRTNRLPYVRNYKKMTNIKSSQNLPLLKIQVICTSLIYVKLIYKIKTFYF